MNRLKRVLFNIENNECGIALIMALYIVIVFVMLGMVMTTIMLALHTSSRQQMVSLKAYYVAQSGAEYALNELKGIVDDDWRKWVYDGSPINELTKGPEDISLDSAGTSSGNYPKFTITYDYPVVGAWEFNDFHDTGTATDNSGNGNDGSITGASYIDNTIGESTNHQYGKALEFGGSNEYVNCGDINDLDTPGYFTVEVWFYRDTHVGSSTNHGINNVLVAKSSNSSNDNLEIGSHGTSVEIYIDSDGYDGSGSFNAGIQNGRWYFLVLKYDKDASNEVKVYVYDSSDDSLVTQEWSSWGGNLDSSGSSEFCIGIARGEDPGGSKWGDFDGYIDSVRIYNRALGSDEVEAHYNNGVFPIPFDVRRYLKIESEGDVQYQEGSSTLTATRKIELTVPRDID